MLALLKRRLSKAQKHRLKAYVARVRALVVRTFFAYDAPALAEALCRLGVESGDALMVHVAFDPLNGFQGDAGLLIDVLQQSVGPTGHLLMMSMPYAGTARDYVDRGVPFNAKRSISRMGVVTEVFRRRPNVARSLNPIHPILVHGPRARWLVEGHEHCEQSCGFESPMQRFHELGGKILFFDAPFNTLTFVHYLEAKVQGSLPFKLYEDDSMIATIVDAMERTQKIPVRVFSADAIRWRNVAPLEEALSSNDKLRTLTCGRTNLALVETADLVTTALTMVADGRGLYPPPKMLAPDAGSRAS